MTKLSLYEGKHRFQKSCTGTKILGLCATNQSIWLSVTVASEDYTYHHGTTNDGIKEKLIIIANTPPQKKVKLSCESEGYDSHNFRALERIVSCFIFPPRVPTGEDNPTDTDAMLERSVFNLPW